MDKQLSISRRTALKKLALLAVYTVFLSSCKREPYRRPPKRVFLGDPNKLLLPIQKVEAEGMMVFRDKNGWSSMDARCSYEGCDLSYTGRNLYCSCCSSYFSLDGRVLRGKADKNLNYYQLGYANRQLFAQSESIEKADYRYTSEELEKLVMRTLLEIESDGPSALAPVPGVVDHWKNEETLPMFRPYDEQEVEANYRVETEEEKRIKELKDTIQDIKQQNSTSLSEQLKALKEQSK